MMLLRIYFSFQMIIEKLTLRNGSRYCNSNRKKIQTRRGGGRVPKAPSLIEELLAVDSCWGSLFFVGRLPIGCPCPSA